MYKIYADNTLIYDSTLEDYKIGKGQITLETDKIGSFVFSLYPDHFYYDEFIRLKTVIKVCKDDRIIFRGRILNDVTDYWNNKVITCEGELGFLQDSIIRPFKFSGTPKKLFTTLINSHNVMVDDFKMFNIGTISVEDTTGDGEIERENSAYESTLSNINSRLLDAETTGGHILITHGEDGTEERPTIHYLESFIKTATQTVEFGSNLKNYTKTIKAEDIATAIIPLGADIDSGSEETQKLTIKDANSGSDYIASKEGVELYGLIFKTVEWSDVTTASALKTKAEKYLADIIKHSITLELTAIDLHLIDRSIESFNIGEYVRVISAPHNIDMTLLCSKQTIDLLKPENDSIILGRTYPSFSEYNSKKLSNALKRINNSYSKSEIKSEINNAISQGGFVSGDQVNNMINNALNNNESNNGLNDGTYSEDNAIIYRFNMLVESSAITVESLYQDDTDNIYAPLHISVTVGRIRNVRVAIDQSLNNNNLTLTATDSEGNTVSGTWANNNGYWYFTVDSAVKCSDIYIRTTYVSDDGQTYTAVPLNIDKTDADGDGKAERYAILVRVTE